MNWKEGLDYGTSILREVQEEGGDPESKAGSHEEQAPRDQGYLPEMPDNGVPHR